MLSIKLIRGSSRHMTELADNSINFCVTSPPYINAIDYNRSNDENIGNYDGLDYYKMVYDVYSEVYRVLQPGRRFCLDIQDIPAKDEIAFVEPVGFKSMLLCQKLGFTLSAIIIWNKGRCRPGGTPLGTMPFPASPNILGNFEYIFVLRKPGTPDYSHVTDEMRAASKLSTQDIADYIYSVWDMKPEMDRTHPAAFPPELPFRCIRLFSFAGETILEPFAGSGTTMRVARDLHRSAVGFEIEEKYCKMIKSRVVFGQQFLDGSEQYDYQYIVRE